MQTYSFKELIPIIKHNMENGSVPFIWGPPGIGKSALAEYVAKLLGAQFTCLDAPLLDPTSYAVAVPDHVQKKVVLYSTGYLPSTGNWVVAIEDLPHAKTYQQTPIMQIVLNHRIANLVFDKSIKFIASGNREEDLAFTQPIGSQLLNRFVHYNLEPNVDEWADWARREELDERVIGFNLSFPQYHSQYPKEGVKAYPTPRTNEFFARNIKGLKDGDINMIRAQAMACIGEGAAAAFMSWFKYLRSVNPRMILDSGNIPQTSDRSEVFANVFALGTYIKTFKKEQVAKDALKIGIVFSKITSDFKITFIKELLVMKHGKPDSWIFTTIMQNSEAAKLIDTKLLVECISM